MTIAVEALGSVEWAVLLAACATAMAGGWSMWSTLRGTTLVAALYWSVAAVVGLAVSESLIVWFGGGAAWVGHVRYGTACLFLAPTVALLGAKRPQHRAWQFVVGTLLVVLWLPGLEGLAYNPSSMLELHPARRWFGGILLLMVLVCYLPTRSWLAAVLAAAGQYVLLAGTMPAFASLTFSRGPLIAGLLFAAASLSARRSARPRGASTADRFGFESAWRDFRACYGWLWAVRVSERLNTTASRRGWPLRLRWSGQIDVGDGTVSAEAENGLRRAGRELLRRFVSEEWIVERMGPA